VLTSASLQRELHLNAFHPFSMCQIVYSVPLMMPKHVNMVHHVNFFCKFFLDDPTWFSLLGNTTEFHSTWDPVISLVHWADGSFEFLQSDSKGCFRWGVKAMKT
jgi:hypothetical protein